MSYTKLLNQIIELSGLQLKEIADRCQLYGERITPSYISTLKNNEGRIPSDNVSRAIAKACNTRFEDILVIQAYLDNAPESITGLLDSIKNTANDDWPEDIPEALKSQLSLAEFICQSYENLDLVPIESAYDTNIKSVTNVTATDNSMEPLISKGNQVSIKSGPVSDGDIIALLHNKRKEVIIRKAIMLDQKKWALVPINSEYKTELLYSNEFSIFGRAYQIIKNIK